jgi:hypothetical protein
MRRKQLTIPRIYGIGLVLLAFSFVPQASAFNEPDPLNIQIKATAIKGESIDQVFDLLVSESAMSVDTQSITT